MSRYWRELAALVLLVAGGPVFAATAPQQCADLWARHPDLSEENLPVYATYEVPSDGVVEGASMRRLRRPDGTAFIPASIDESNCFLDRVLDERTRRGLRVGAEEMMKSGRSVPMADRIQLLLQHACVRGEATQIDEALHCSTLSSVLTNLDRLYGISAADGANGPFVQYSSRLGIYSGSNILWYALLSYAQHLGVRRLPIQDFLKSFRAADRHLAPPTTLKASGCAGGIDYKWPTITSVLDGDEVFPNDERTHVGVCRATGEPWRYHHSVGWRPLTTAQKAELCAAWPEESWCRKGSP
jgi:hypothetical protein